MRRLLGFYILFYPVSLLGLIATLVVVKAGVAVPILSLCRLLPCLGLIWTVFLFVCKLKDGLIPAIRVVFFYFVE